MRPARTVRMIPVLMVVLFLTLPAPAQYSGGTGEPNDPYQIATADDLMLLGETPEDYDKHFILTADIDLEHEVFDRAVIAPDRNDAESGFQGAAFSGVFDGNGHTIAHLTIGGGSYLGLFGQLGSGAIISSLGMEAVDVNGTGHPVGGLVGWNRRASITHCYSTGTVSGYWIVGGLVGDNNEGSVTNCYSNGSVNGDAYIGGLVGANHEGSTTHCYSTGTVSGNQCVGGLVGRNFLGSITHCYSTATVSGDWSVGGLVGDNFLGSITSSVWDIQTSGLSGSAGGAGLTTAEMMDPYMLGLNGFADDPNWVLDAGHDYPRLAWEGSPGQIITEPVIDWMEGSGTAEAPYRIDTSDQLILLSKAGILWERHFVLGADIDMDPNLPGGRLFTQAVIPHFTGVFDGNDHTISHLTIEGGSYLGLLGLLGSGAIISSLGMEAVDVNGTGDCVGGLVGGNDEGSVTHCYSNGSVNGDRYVGGLVGWNDDGGSITHCYSTGTVNGEYKVGGLVGWNGGFAGSSITNCYSTGTVNGNHNVGGLVGENFLASITHCYSTGAVSGEYNVGGLVGENGGFAGSSITNCYSTGTVSGNDNVGGLVGIHNGGSVTSSYSNGSVNGDRYVGGLVGFNYGPVTDSYSTGRVFGINFGAGGLVGWNDREGSITMSYSTSAVDGNSYVGGLVGGNSGTGNTDDDGMMTMSYSSGPVTGGDAVGGLVGTNAGRVSDCYCTGTVAGGYRVGGLVGYNGGGGDITDSYSTGTVSGNDHVSGLVGRSSGSITSSFWDIQTSGLKTSDGGTGKTTAAMQTASTFLHAGWDFVDETENGTDDIWWILEGQDYPRLWWEAQN